MMSKYILFFSDNTLKARFDSAINADIPADAVEVTEQQFWQTINEKDGIWIRNGNGQIIKNPLPELTKKERVRLQKLKINRDFTAAVEALVGDVPADEIMSWRKQEAEAEAYLADNTVSTPLIDAIATARNVPKDILASKIMDKSDAFSTLIGSLIGKRQALEDQLDALPANAKRADIEAIVWS